MAAGAPYPVAAAGGGGWGVAQTITARGILTHGVRLAAGRVADYQIWAPTDCLFADAGMLPGLLDAPPLNSVNAARQLLDQAILALDPCVPYVVELKYA
jgi:coenzyme F420-reducing hydrogenase alpha subunit